MKKIIDISHYQQVTDWQKVKDSVEFVIVKAGQSLYKSGKSGIDSKAVEYVNACEKHGIPYWLYQYVTKGHESLGAMYLMDNWQKKVGKYFCGFAMDYEDGNVASDIQKSLMLLLENGYKVMSYCDPKRYGMEAWYNSRPLNLAVWDARYGKNAESVKYDYSKYPVSSTCDLHQYCSTGSVPGIKGNVDLNVIYSDRFPLEWYKTSAKYIKEEKPMDYMIGSARIDENGNASGGRAGDQTNKEVMQEKYYLHKKGWFLLRPKEKDAELAQAMIDACNNKHIGYDQSNRHGVFNQVKAGKKISAINIDTECDCSGLVRACILQAFGKDPGSFTTHNEPSVLEKSGLFYTRIPVKKDTLLRVGDVLCTQSKGHTVIVTQAKTSFPYAAVTNCTVNVRKNPGTKSMKCVTFGPLKKGQIVSVQKVEHCKDDGLDWAFIETNWGNSVKKAWVSLRRLDRI